MEDNIYTYLKLDHKKVSNLFKLFDSAETEKNQLEIFELIKKELLVHAQSEQATFYKALEVYAKAQPDILHAEDEHDQILTKLEEISQHKKVNANMKKQMKELQKIVDHHVSEEEGKIFREARKLLPEEEAYNLKFKMHDYKEKILNGIIEPELALN